MDEVLSAESVEFNDVINKLIVHIWKSRKGRFCIQHSSRRKNMDLLVHQNDFVQKMSDINYSNQEPYKLLIKDESRMLKKSTKSA